MTEKAKKILRKMNKRKVLKGWKEFSYSGRREKILTEFNRENLDDVGPVGGDQSMTLLKDMNDLEAGHDEFLWSMEGH
jgi:hypothetical protein